MSLFDQYLLVFLFSAIVVGYLMFRMIKSLLGTMNRMWYPQQYPMQYLPPPTTVAPQQRPQQGVDRWMIIIILIIVGIAIYSNWKQENKHGSSSPIRSTQFSHNTAPSRGITHISDKRNLEKYSVSAERRTTKNKSDYSSKRKVAVQYYLQIKAGNSWRKIMQSAHALPLGYSIYVGIKQENYPYKLLISAPSDQQRQEQLKTVFSEIAPSAFIISNATLQDIHAIENLDRF